MLKQAKELIDVVNMSISQMNITTKHASRINISKLSTCNQQPIIPKHIERSIHWSTNQMSHFSQLEFNFDPLNIPNKVVILWIRVFHMRPYSTRLTFHLFGENLIFRKRLGVATYFCFIFKEKNKINKNPKCDSWRKKNRFVKNQI